MKTDGRTELLPELLSELKREFLKSNIIPTNDVLRLVNMCADYSTYLMTLMTFVTSHNQPLSRIVTLSRGCHGPRHGDNVTSVSEIREVIREVIYHL